MKTLKLRIAKLSVVSLVLLLSMSFTTNRSCNDFYLTNTSSCIIDYTITITDLPGCTTCLGPDPHSILPGSTLRLPCGSCTNQCNIYITVTDVGGNSVMSSPVDMFNNTTQVITGAIAPCTTVTSISFNGNTFTI